MSFFLIPTFEDRNFNKKKGRTRASDAQCSLGLDKTSVRNPRNPWWTRRHVLPIFWIVYASVIHFQTWRKRICSGFRCVRAHDEQEGFELITIGNSASIKGSSGSNYDKWFDWNERGSSCVRPRLGFTRDGVAPWRHSVSPTSWQTLENHWFSYEWIEDRKSKLFTRDRKTFLSHQELLVDSCFWYIRWRRQFMFNIRISWISFVWRQYSSGPISWENSAKITFFFRKSELEVKN